MNNLIKKWSSLAIPLAGFAATLLVAVLYVYQPAWLRNIDLRLYDTVLKKGHNAGTSHAQLLADVERAHIRALLNTHAGHRSRVAASLGITERTLYRKLKRYGPS